MTILGLVKRTQWLISVYLPSADRKVNSIHKEVYNKYHLTDKENIILIQVRIVLYNFFFYLKQENIIKVFVSIFLKHMQIAKIYIIWLVRI